jgi:hypothetical protein
MADYASASEATTTWLRIQLKLRQVLGSDVVDKLYKAAAAGQGEACDVSAGTKRKHVSLSSTSTSISDEEAVDQEVTAKTKKKKKRKSDKFDEKESFGVSDNELDKFDDDASMQLVNENAHVQGAECVDFYNMNDSGPIPDIIPAGATAEGDDNPHGVASAQGTEKDNTLMAAEGVANNGIGDIVASQAVQNGNVDNGNGQCAGVDKQCNPVPDNDGLPSTGNPQTAGTPKAGAQVVDEGVSLAAAKKARKLAKRAARYAAMHGDNVLPVSSKTVDSMPVNGTQVSETHVDSAPSVKQMASGGTSAEVSANDNGVPIRSIDNNHEKTMTWANKITTAWAKGDGAPVGNIDNNPDEDDVTFLSVTPRSDKAKKKGSKAIKALETTDSAASRTGKPTQTQVGLVDKADTNTPADKSSSKKKKSMSKADAVKVKLEVLDDHNKACRATPGRSGTPSARGGPASGIKPGASPMCSIDLTGEDDV